MRLSFGRSQWRKGVARVALFMFSCAIVLITAGAVMPKPPGQWSQFALGVSTSLLTLGMTALFVQWDRLDLKDVGAAISSTSWMRLAIGFLIGLSLVALQAGIVGFVGHVRLVRSPEIGFSSSSTALATYLVLSCREELAFRGYPLRRLDWFLGPYTAQLLVASAFAVEHVAGGYDWTTALLGVATGSLLFGMAALATRGLAVPIGLHTAWNFGQWVIGGKEDPGFWRAVIEQKSRAQLARMGMISYLIVMALATFGFWCFYRQRMGTDRQ
jgi:CAAX protease family protein